MKKQNWINLLGNTKEFRKIENESKTTLFALCKYKAILRDRGRGKVEFEEVEVAYKNNDINGLHKLLNEMFLEFYTSNEINNFVKLMKKTGTSMREVYDRHVEEPEDTLLSHLSL